MQLNRSRAQEKRKNVLNLIKFSLRKQQTGLTCEYQYKTLNTILANSDCFRERRWGAGVRERTRYLL